MANPWFRLYAEFAHDPKVQMMSEVMQRRYVMIMCMRCSNDLVTLHETEIAFHLRVTETELSETKALFVSKGFIDDEWNLLNWEKRQFKSDSSAERVARHRAKKKTTSNGNVTLQKRRSNALDTDTDTDTDNKKTNKKDNPDTVDPADTSVVSLASPGHESDKPPSPVSPHGAIATYVRSQGIHAVSTDLELQNLVKAGATMAHFVDAVPICRENHKGWKYLLGIVKNMLQEAQAPPPTTTARPSKEPYDPRSYFEKDKPNDDNIIDANFIVVGEK